MLWLRSLMEDDDPLAATTQVDKFGMTPLHTLSLSQTPNLDMLQALMMKAGRLDHIIRGGRDSFGFTPMDYLCLNRMPSSTETIRGVLHTRFDYILSLDRSWKSDMLQADNDALAVDWSSRRRKVVAVYLQHATYERKEIFSAVELFLWKVKIEEIGSKEKEQQIAASDREGCRINSGASIVIPYVLPFLEKLGVEDYFVDDLLRILVP